MNDKQLIALKTSLKVLSKANSLYFDAIRNGNVTLLNKALRLWNSQKRLYYYAHGNRVQIGYKGMV